MIHLVVSESEWDRRYKANLARAEKKAAAKAVKEAKKPGPKKARPTPKNKPMGTIVLNLWGTKE